MGILNWEPSPTPIISPTICKYAWNNEGIEKWLSHILRNSGNGECTGVTVCINMCILLITVPRLISSARLSAALTFPFTTFVVTRYSRCFVRWDFKPFPPFLLSLSYHALLSQWYIQTLRCRGNGASPGTVRKIQLKMIRPSNNTYFFKQTI